MSTILNIPTVNGDNKITHSVLPTIPQSKISGLETAISGLDGRGISATAENVNTDSPDNSNALLAIAQKYQSLTERTVVHLPPGVIRGRLPMAPGVVWKLNGTVFKFPTSGPTGHLVYPLDWAWWGDRSGLGAHRSGIHGPGRIDGENDLWDIWPAPKGPDGTATSIGSGSINISGNRVGYRIAYLTEYGHGMPGSQASVDVDPAGAARLNWTNPPEAAGLEVMVFGRTPGNWWEQKPMATLPAGSTEFVDDGSITPSGPACRRLDISAPSNIICGATFDVTGVTIENMSGTSLVTRFDADVPKGEGRQLMEAVIHDVKIRRSGAEAIGFSGPHDTTIDTCFIADSGKHGPGDTKAPRTHIMLADSGPLVIRNSHTWGYSDWGIQNFYRAEVNNCQVEGGSLGQINVQFEARINDTEVFWPQGSEAVGIRVGEPWYNPKVQMEGVHAKGFDSDSGPALDLRYMGEGSRIRGMVSQDTGEVFRGDLSRGDIDVTVYGDLSDKSITAGTKAKAATGFVVSTDESAPYSTKFMWPANVALQNAIDDAAANGGGVVTVMPGYYAMREPITVKPGVTVRGHGKGTEIAWDVATSKAGMNLFTVQEDSKLSDFTAIGKRSDGVTGDGVLLDGNRATIENCTLTEFAGIPLKVGDAASHTDYLVSRVRVKACDDIGVNVSGSAGRCTITHSTIEGAGGVGLRSEGTDLEVSHTKVIDSVGNGVELRGTSSHCSHVKVLGAGGVGVKCAANNVVLDECHVFESSGVGFEVAWGNGVSLIGCVSETTGGDGFKVLGGITRWVLSGCRSRDWRSNKVTPNGIRVLSGGGAIVGCICLAGDHSAAGISVDSGVAADVVASGNLE